MKTPAKRPHTPSRLGILMASLRPRRWLYPIYTARQLRLERHEISSAHVPRSLSGLKLAYASDIHYGALLDDMFFHDGSDIPTDRFIVPRIEVELAFVLAKPLRGPNCTLFDVYNATDYVIPALELIDARCHNIDPETQRPRKVFDTISDNAANAGVILGGRPIKPDELDLRWISALMYRNGVIEETGVAAGVLNHPANGVAWLANKLAPYDVQLEAGQIILGGSFTRPVPARKGDTFHVDYGNMGSISCRFV